MTAPYSVSAALDDDFNDRVDVPSQAQVGPVLHAPNSPTGGLGALLELDETKKEDEQKICDTIIKYVTDQEPARRRRRIIAERNRLWMKGVRGVRARPISENLNEWELFIPLGALDLPPVMDRCEELIERVVSHLLADKPLPEAEPADDSDEEREAAEFTTRLLQTEADESGSSPTSLYRRCARKASISGSGFIYTCVDPKGGGWQPMEIQAHPQAQTKDDALKNPLTGADARLDELETRYVRKDGTLTDNPNEAAIQWKPKLRDEILTPEQVVLLPEDSSGIGDADGAVVIRAVRVAELRSKFPIFAKMTDDEIRPLLEWHPAAVKKADRSADQRKPYQSGVGPEVPDTAKIFTLSLIFRSHGAYPKGAYIVVAGGKRVLWKKPWTAMVERDQQLVEECLDINLAQIRQLDDDVDDDHMGRGLVGVLGPLDEVRSTTIIAWLEHLEKITHPIPFIPMGSPIQPEQIRLRDDTPIYFNPAGKPEMEQIPPFPPDAKEFFDRTTEAGNSAVALQETAQAMQTPSTKSGVKAAIDIQQTEKNLSSMRDNLADGITRHWRIKTQQMRAFFTVPQLLQYESDDSSFRQKEWSRVDLGSTRQIRIASGTFTQMTPEQKEAMADKLVQMTNPATGQSVIDFDEYKRLIANNVGPKAGIRDNPHVLRVKRQLSKWFDGPPQDFQAQQQKYQLQVQQWQAVAQLAQQQGQQPPAPPTAPYDPFDVRPVDDVPDVAKIRYNEFAREMAGSRYAKQIPDWQALFNAAYDRARKAAGVMTLQEQQQAQQQQAMQQEQQRLAEVQAAHDREDASREHDAAAHQSDQAHELRKLELQGAQRAQRVGAA